MVLAPITLLPRVDWANPEIFGTISTRNEDQARLTWLPCMLPSHRCDAWNLWDPICLIRWWSFGSRVLPLGRDAEELFGLVGRDWWWSCGRWDEDISQALFAVFSWHRVLEQHFGVQSRELVQQASGKEWVHRVDHDAHATKSHQKLPFSNQAQPTLPRLCLLCWFSECSAR